MIPTYQIGERVFSATFTRFAADSMIDISGELQRIAGLLEDKLKQPQYVALDPWRERVQAMSVDIPAMVAAARYSRWLSDKLLEEIPYWKRRDLATAEKMAEKRPDEAGWYKWQQESIEEPIVSAGDAPPFPGALREMHRLQPAENYEEQLAAKLEHLDAKRFDEVNAIQARLTEHGYAYCVYTIRETLDEVAGAIARSQTPHTDNLLEPVRALIAWLRASES
jgi:hypothetical protein